MSEEWGSVYLGAKIPLFNILIESNYHNNFSWGSTHYEPVDSLLAKFHWTRKNETITRTDTEPTPDGFNDLDGGDTINNLYFNDPSVGLLKKEYQELEQLIKDAIEN